MLDFLSFKSFISIKVLIGFYYLGVVFLPLLVWWLSQKRLRYRLLAQQVMQNMNTYWWQHLTQKQKLQLGLVLLGGFLFLQLFWRMLFEFLIAYMQIRDALLATSLSS